MVGGLDPRKGTLEEARGAIPRAKRERLASTRSMAAAGRKADPVGSEE